MFTTIDDNSTESIILFQHPWGKRLPCWASPQRAAAAWAEGWSARWCSTLPDNSQSKINVTQKWPKCELKEINKWVIRSTQMSAPSPHQWDRQHGREMGGSSAWNRLAAGTSADTWRTPGHPAWCWSLSWRTSVEWTKRKLDQKRCGFQHYYCNCPCR